MVLADLFRILVGLVITVAVVLILHTATVLPFLNADTSGFGLTRTRSGYHTQGISAQEILSDTRHNPFSATHVIMLAAVDAEILQSRMETGGVNVGGPDAGGQGAVHLMGTRNIRISDGLSFRPHNTLPLPSWADHHHTSPLTLLYIQTLASINSRQITLTPWAGQNLGHPLLLHGTADTRFNIMVHGYGNRSTIHFFTEGKPERLIWSLHSPPRP